MGWEGPGYEASGLYYWLLDATVWHTPDRPALTLAELMLSCLVPA